MYWNDCGCNSHKSPLTDVGNISGEVHKEAVVGEALPKTFCGKKVTSITEVGDKVLIAYEDCSYSLADKEVVHLSKSQELLCIAKEVKALQEAVKVNETSIKNKEAEIKALTAKVEELADKEDKDTIYDDSVLKASISSLEKSLEGKADKGITEDLRDVTERLSALESKPEPTPYDDSELISKINSIKSKLDGVVMREELVVVNSLENAPLFKAIPVGDKQ